MTERAVGPPRRFKATMETVYRDLQSTLRQMGASNLRVGQEFDTGQFEIVFDRTGRRYVFRCKRWPVALDNFRAAQRTISLLYQAMEEYGTERKLTDIKAPAADPFEQFFLAFEALPDDSVLLLGSGLRDWWEVLGVPKTASKADITAAYRALAHVHHPDVGGDVETFKRLRQAYEEGLRAAA
jgi:hypothetical protein